ncbi:hypothetical protein KA005_81465 [bacterium]|nr:hypothetical protein [bacterium]
MSLKAGTPRKDGDKYLLDNTALSNSMALAIDQEMKKLYEKMKGTTMPDVGQEDRRILFTAISRGILKYLEANADDLIRTISLQYGSGAPYMYNVTQMDLDIKVQNLPS